MDKKRVIQFQAFESIYNDRLQNELNKDWRFQEEFENIRIICDAEKEEYEKKRGIQRYELLGKWRKLCYLILFNKYLCHKYRNLKKAVVNIQFIEYRFLFLLPFISCISNKLILSFWGSDLLRQEDKILRRMRHLFNKADLITVETDEMEKIFLNRTNKKYKAKIQKVRFGLTSIKDIDNLDKQSIIDFKITHGIDLEKKVVAIGYNRRKEHQHIKAIQSIIEANINPRDIFIIIPWTYGPDDIEYRGEIESLLQDRYDYCFISERLTDCEVAALRVSTDIMIHVQTTDSLSASMLETLYAENEVIAGDWLPYGELLALGVTMRMAKKVEDCGRQVKLYLNMPMDEREKKKNKELVYKYSSWDTNILKWIDLYK